MTQNFRLPVQLAIASVLSLTFCAALAVDAAHAARPSGKSKARSARSPRSQDRMMRDDQMSNRRIRYTYDELRPVAASYPEAAPGSLDMMHWTDIRRMHTAEGSAADEYKIKTQVRLDDRLSNEPIRTQYDDFRPVAPSYPSAMPGSLDTYHFTNFKRNHTYEGSAADMYKIKTQNRLDNRLSKTPLDEDDFEPMPVATSYPQEAPGNLDMSHWTDFRRMHQRSGSAMEAHKMKKDMR